MTVGRLIQRKGVYFFVDQVLPRLRARRDDWVCLIIGDGPEREAIATAVRERGLEDIVHLLGRVPDDELQAAYALADVFVMPNIHLTGDSEGFGIVTFEARMAGLPVVAADLEGIADSFEREDDGVLVPPGDALAFVAALDALLATKLTLEARRARHDRTARRYSWDRVIEMYLVAFQAVQDRETVAPLWIASRCLWVCALRRRSSATIGWLAALAEYGPEHHYWVFVSRYEPELAAFSNLKQLISPVANRFLVRLWAQAAIPLLLWRTGADLYHATKNLSVIGVPCPVVITVNDLTHVLLTTRYYPWLDNMYWRWVQPFMLRRAVRIIAISESTRQGLINCYGLDEHKVEVIYPSYHARYRQAAGETARAAVRVRYGLPESYILYVGGLGLHKNVATLVSSFDAIADRVPHGLVLVGGNYHSSSDQALFRTRPLKAGRSVASGCSMRCRRRTCPAIYQMADLFVLPSLNEGFGLTLLEAMASGVPVMASCAGAIPEVAGDAGCLLSAIRDQEALAKTLLALLDSPQGSLP